MTTLNSTKLIDRPNRPGVLQRVGLRAIFINNGVLTDPYEISSVTVFAKAHNTSPSSILTDEQEVDSSVSASIKMHFANTASLTSNAGFNENNYVPAVLGGAASGIYKLRTGDYVCVLDGSINLSGNLSSIVGYHSPINNTASAVQDYIDVWTVRHVEGSKATTVVNNFRLFDDNFVVITQPMLLEPKHKLVNKHVRLGEVIDLKVLSELTITNQDIDESIRNIFEQAVLTGGQFQIEKINEEDGMPGHVTVSAFDQTETSVEITSDDTLIFTWDTNVLKTWSSDPVEQQKREDIGSPRGTYSVQVKYTMVGETRISPRFYFQLN